MRCLDGFQSKIPSRKMRCVWFKRNLHTYINLRAFGMSLRAIVLIGAKFIDSEAEILLSSFLKNEDTNSIFKSTKLKVS